MFIGCPVDQENPSKRWCSTKVDSRGNHIVNQNEFGFCANDCPEHSKHSETNGHVEITGSFSSEVENGGSHNTVSGSTTYLGMNTLLKTYFIGFSV